MPNISSQSSDVASLLGGDNTFPLSRGKEKNFELPAQQNKMRTCGLLDFEDFFVNPGIIPNTWFLIVNGKLTSISIQVSLVPRTYVRQPEYWGIEVVGFYPPIMLPMKGVFVETLAVTEFMGTKGLEIIGATRTEIWHKP